jgi:hypothetical protein
MYSVWNDEGQSYQYLDEYFQGSFWLQPSIVKVKGSNIGMGDFYWNGKLWHYLWLYHDQYEKEAGVIAYDGFQTAEYFSGGTGFVKSILKEGFYKVIKRKILSLLGPHIMLDGAGDLLDNRPPWAKGKPGGYVNWLQNLENEKKILTAAEANSVIDEAKRLGVNVRLDPPHPGTNWDKPHLNFGSNGQVHLEVPSGYDYPDIPHGGE